MGIELRARDPSIGVAEWLCDGVAVTFLPCTVGLEPETLVPNKRLRNWVLFMSAKATKSHVLHRRELLETKLRMGVRSVGGKASAGKATLNWFDFDMLFDTEWHLFRPLACISNHLDVQNSDEWMDTRYLKCNF